MLGNIINHTAGKQVERETLAFFMGGFQYKYRYWEIMYMFQKMGTVVILNFMPRSWSPHLSIYGVLWLTIAFLILTQVLASPSSSVPSHASLPAHTLRPFAHAVAFALTPGA